MKEDSKRGIIGRRIVELRRLHGIKSSAEVARALGLKEATVRKYESEGNVPRENLPKIAKFFGVSVEYLMGIEDEQKSEKEKPLAVHSPEGKYIVAEDPGELNENEMLLIHKWRALSENEQGEVGQFIEEVKRKRKNKTD